MSRNEYGFFSFSSTTIWKSVKLSEIMGKVEKTPERLFFHVPERFHI